MWHLSRCDVTLPFFRFLPQSKYLVKEIMLVWTHTYTQRPLLYLQTWHMIFFRISFPLMSAYLPLLNPVMPFLLSDVLAVYYFLILSWVSHLFSPWNSQSSLLGVSIWEVQLFPISTRFPPPLRRTPALYRSWSPSFSLRSDSVPTLLDSDCQLPSSSWRGGFGGSFCQVFQLCWQSNGSKEY